MKAYTFTLDGYTFRRVNRTKARTAYAHHLSVIFCPCNLRPGAPWHPEAAIDPRNDPEASFDTVDNLFTWYNCTNSETGRRPAYYIPVRTVDGIEEYDYSFMEGGKERA